MPLVPVDQLIFNIKSLTNIGTDEPSRFNEIQIHQHIMSALHSVAKRVAKDRNQKDLLQYKFTFLVTGQDSTTGAYLVNLVPGVEDAAFGRNLLVIDPPFDAVYFDGVCRALYTPLPFCDDECDRLLGQSFYHITGNTMEILTPETLAVNDEVYVEATRIPRYDKGLRTIDMPTEIMVLVVEEVARNLALLRQSGARHKG